MKYSLNKNNPLDFFRRQRYVRLWALQSKICYIANSCVAVDQGKTGMCRHAGFLSQ